MEDSENVKEFIANRNVSQGRKENLANIYGRFAEYHGIPFKEPRFTREDSLPFIPLQQELEALINATRNLRHATVLRILFESGARVGEATRLQFKDFDFEKKTVRIVPEKGSRAREVRISDRMVSMLKQVYSQYPKNPLPDDRTARRYFERTRKFLAQTQNNPRFLNTHLHSFRHFRATMLYHQTKDIIYTQQVLGHKSLSNTMRY